MKYLSACILTLFFIAGVQCQQGAIIKGRVTDKDGPVALATVTATSRLMSTYKTTAITDKDGLYQIEVSNSGEYLISATKIQIGKSNEVSEPLQPVSVTNGATQTVDLELRLITGPSEYVEIGAGEIQTAAQVSKTVDVI